MVKKNCWFKNRQIYEFLLLRQDMVVEQFGAVHYCLHSFNINNRRFFTKHVRYPHATDVVKITFVN